MPSTGIKYNAALKNMLSFDRKLIDSLLGIGDSGTLQTQYIQAITTSWLHTVLMNFYEESRRQHMTAE